MNKADLISEIAKKSELTKSSAEKMLNSFIDVVKTHLKKGDKITLVGFGTFSVLQRKATTGVNPKTRQKINIPAKKVAKLKFSDSINDSLNNKKK